MTSNNPLQNSGASVFYPSLPSAAENLKNATLFTRLHIRATPQVAQQAIDSTPTLRNTFLLVHLNDVLIFDTEKEAHIVHVSAVLKMLEEKGMKADINLCAFDKPDWTSAGFYIDPIGNENENRAGGKQAFMIVLREHLTEEALAAIDRKL
ncbi:hypothetical protein BOTCAL_0003g00290 [Botryotinia calthae]|uniref:Uncharacterized protein n=1 Tax=Botryotinia calthae TaxID=38488 RepID=A0A4Y8DK91_9HELO|nr:hypothetical protein BOTCAL_0003g00290 [Botryotinia calthae]